MTRIAGECDGKVAREEVRRTRPLLKIAIRIALCLANEFL